jgi:hypothetical protein
MSKYGIYNATTDSWSGIIGALVNNTDDVAIGAITTNEQRNAAIDFTIPWLYHGIAIMEQKVRENVICLMFEIVRCHVYLQWNHSCNHLNGNCG